MSAIAKKRVLTITKKHQNAMPSSREITKRACDPCHRRKIRCSGGQPCSNCNHSSLVCTYNAVPQKKGPKGSRSKVISELRKRSENPLETLQGPTVQTPLLLTETVLHVCIDFFFNHMYPTMPILYRPHLQDLRRNMGHDIEAYCLITSLCAFVMIQTGIKSTSRQDQIGGSSKVISGVEMLQEALRARRSYDHVVNPKITTVITSFFFFGAFFGLDDHNPAWFYLREATTFATILGLHREDSYHSRDNALEKSCRRLFWLLFITERAYALQRHRPITLHGTIELPRPDEDPNETTEINGFLYLQQLFRPFDDVFIGLWNNTRADCTPARLALLQRQLVEALPWVLSCTPSQRADLKTSQQWLRILVWQLSTSNGCLSSTSSETSMTFKYPVEIARDMAAVTSQLSQQSLEVHGIGLVEKIFDISCSLIDVMALVPLNRNGFAFGPRDYLRQLITLISTLRGGSSRYLPIVTTKLNEQLPEMVMPLSTSPEMRANKSLLPGTVIKSESNDNNDNDNNDDNDNVTIENSDDTDASTFAFTPVSPGEERPFDHNAVNARCTASRISNGYRAYCCTANAPTSPPAAANYSTPVASSSVMPYHCPVVAAFPDQAQNMNTSMLSKISPIMDSFRLHLPFLSFRASDNASANTMTENFMTL